MPLSKARQAEWMRNYRKRNGYNVIPSQPVSVIPETASKTGKLASLRALIAKKEGKPTPVGYNVIPESSPESENIYSLPVYDWHVHGPGTRVRVFRGGRWVVMTVPEGAEVGN